jgi:hypothetical protein
MIEDRSVPIAYWVVVLFLAVAGLLWSAYRCASAPEQKEVIKIGNSMVIGEKE